MAKLTHLRAKLGLRDKIILTKQLLTIDIFVPDSKAITLFQNVLMKGDETVRKWGGELYFVYLPTSERYAFKVNHDFYREQVLSTVKGLGIPIIDTHKAFNNHDDPLILFSYIGGHYNSAGYRLVADYIVTYIKNE